MEKNVVFIGLIISTFILTPFLFLDIKKLPKLMMFYFRFHLIILIIGWGTWMSGSAVPILGNSYRSSNVPNPIKDKIDLFVLEAEKRNIDVSKIKEIEIIYLPWTINPAVFNAACNIKENILYIPEKSISTLTIFHELGHCVLGYDHFLDESQSKEIMYYASNENQVLEKETLDRFFYNAPKSSSKAKITETIFKFLWFLLNPITAIFGIVFLLLLYSYFNEYISRKKGNKT